MKTILILIGIIWFIGICLSIVKNEKTLDPQGVYSADLLKPVVCPVCPSCKITVDKIIQDNPTIELPDETISFKYNGEVFTKKMLEEAKIINERWQNKISRLYNSIHSILIIWDKYIKKGNLWI